MSMEQHELFHTFFGLTRGCADVISGEVNIVVPLRTSLVESVHKDTSNYTSYEFCN